MKQIFMMFCLALASQVSTSHETPLVFDSGPRQVTLVELYTSEGCSSCPPADSWIGQFKDDEKLWHEIIPIAFHVDYWNYLGWKDDFARAEFSRRQRQHQLENNINAVYTPGFVINGMEWRGFFNRSPLPGQSEQIPGNLRLKITGNSVSLDYHHESQRESQSPLIANLVLLGSEIQSNIRRGENAGKTLTHNFVVLDHQSKKRQIQTWQFNLNTSPDATAIAAWLSTSDSQVPIQAVGGWLPVYQTGQ